MASTTAQLLALLASSLLIGIKAVFGSLGLLVRWFLQLGLAKFRSEVEPVRIRGTPNALGALDHEKHSDASSTTRAQSGAQEGGLNGGDSSRDIGLRFLHSHGYLVYDGIVLHSRMKPAKHSFRYDARYALIDLDDPPAWFISSSSKHHLSAGGAREMAHTSGSVFLLTIPVSVGYEQNPISVYYCYSTFDKNLNENDLAICISEVTNTPWSDRVRFLFHPSEDRVPKPLHVSPFMDMESSWRLTTSLSADQLKLRVEVSHPELGDFFYASLNAHRMKDVKFPLWALWLAPHKVAIRIYFQAFFLWLKSVPLYIHPKYSIPKDDFKKRATERAERKKMNEKCFLHAPNSSKPNRCPFNWVDTTEWPWN